jgi:N-acyl amino acid synthase of PEP-CTERM/exosortase system
MVENMADAFGQYFEMLPAVSDELKNEVYKLRYQVYCKEVGGLNPDLYPEGLEFDEYDTRSAHYLIRHRKSGIYAATVRLILPDVNDRNKLFPIELHSRIDNYAVVEHIPRNKLAEVSRFCVSKEFKRRKKEAGTQMGIEANAERVITENERRSFPFLTIALIASLVKMSDEHDIHYWYAVTDPALLRFLSALGIYFTAIGPFTDYYGKRQPSLIKVSSLLEGVANKNPDLWGMLTREGHWTQALEMQ